MRVVSNLFGVEVVDPSPAGAAAWLRSLPVEKFFDVSLLHDDEVRVVEFIAEFFPDVLVLFHAELKARAGVLGGGGCLAPVPLSKGGA